MDNKKITEIRPCKWSSWGIEMYARERGGKTEYAYIIEEQKWMTFSIEGDYTLVPVDQHPLIAPLFGERDDTTNLYFIIEGEKVSEVGDGGYIDVEFLEQQHLMTEYATLLQQDVNEAFNERERLYEMGFDDVAEPSGYKQVIRFKHREEEK